jgi:type IV fimbrial biogenesis protein FimT
MKTIINNRGFTIVELIVVMAVIAVLVGIGVPSFFATTSKTALKRATRDLTVELKAARQLAISKNMQYGIVLTAGATDTAARQFRVDTTVAWQDDTGRAKYTIDSRVDLQSGSETVTFNPNGSSLTTTICLENASDSTSRMKIDIYAITGRIEAGSGC